MGRLEEVAIFFRDQMDIVKRLNMAAPLGSELFNFLLEKV